MIYIYIHYDVVEIGGEKKKNESKVPGNKWKPTNPTTTTTDADADAFYWCCLLLGKQQPNFDDFDDNDDPDFSSSSVVSSGK